MVMREIDFGRYETAWMPPHMREPMPYFVEGPYGGGFREAHQFPVQPQEHMFYRGYGGGMGSPYGEPPMARIPRSMSAMPSFGGHYPEPAGAFLERPGPPPRSSSAIPAFAFVPEMPYHEPHGLVRSSSSIPSFREPRESSRPKHHKVGPEIELRVDMCCSKCEGKVKEVLRRVPGIVDVITDRRSSLVTVCGKVDPQAALKAVQKTKKKADFYRKQIYSDNFINFIQSKTGRAELQEDLPELTSSYHQHAPSENGDSHHHAYEDNENLSSYEEYHGDHDDDVVDDEADRSSVHSYTVEEDDTNVRGGYYNAPPTYNREFYRPPVDDRPRYEPPFHSYGARERTPYHESYGEYTSYRPSQGYGPNPGYMKRVISDY